jgi:membrane protein
MNRIKRLVTLLIDTWHYFYHDNCLNRAAALAYTTLLSLVPLFTVAFSVLAAFPTHKDVTKKIQSLIFAYIAPTSAPTIEQYFLNFMDQTAQLPILGMIGLLVTAVLLIFSMEEAFNQIWGVKRSRHGLTAFLLYWAVITLIPIVATLCFNISKVMSDLAKFTNGYLPFVADIIKISLPYLITSTAFTLLYISLPNCSVPTKSAIKASVIATILFELARHAFALYVKSFASYALIYGALATVPIFLVWIYISWAIILFGAVINRVLAEKDLS